MLWVIIGVIAISIPILVLLSGERQIIQKRANELAVSLSINPATTTAPVLVEISLRKFVVFSSLVSAKFLTSSFDVNV